jgi:NlpC/P60 family putative phage cell wall peptidase
MTTRAEVIAEARRWIGTRWRHQGRTEGGLDCVGLLIVVARSLNLIDQSALDEADRVASGYSRYPRGDALRRTLLQHLQPVEIARPADILLFRIDAEPQHLAIAAEHPSSTLSMIHSYALRPHRVIETILDDTWRRRLVAAFALPGVS